MKQTMPTLCSSSAALYPSDSAELSSDTIYHATDSDVFHANEEISVYFHNPAFQNCLCRQDFVDVLFLLSGSCTCKFYKDDTALPAESVFLTEHSFCIIPHQVLHSLFPDKDCRILHIFFRLSPLKSHYSDLISSNNTLLLFFSNMVYQKHYWNYLSFSVAYTEQFDALMTQIYKEYTEKSSCYQNMIYYSCGMLFTLMERQHNSAILVSPSNPIRLVRYDQIYSYICDNYSMTSANDIADYFHISQSYLCKLFQENHTTVTTVIQRVRLQHARSLLEQSDLSVQNIAELVGYHDQTYFIKLFKRYFSDTPYQYRKKHRSTK